MYWTNHNDHNDLYAIYGIKLPAAKFVSHTPKFKIKAWQNTGAKLIALKDYHERKLSLTVVTIYQDA